MSYMAIVLEAKIHAYNLPLDQAIHGRNEILHTFTLDKDNLMHKISRLWKFSVLRIFLNFVHKLPLLILLRS